MRTVEQENESLREELSAGDSLRSEAAGEITALRNELDESKRDLLQRNDERSILLDQLGDAERSSTARTTKIEQLLRSAERNEADIAERDIELNSLRVPFPRVSGTA